MLKITQFPSSRAIIKNVRKTVTKELVGFGNDLLVNVRDETPYKEGRARRGWVKSATTKDRVTLTNRVPYIELLERNRSRQTEGLGIIRPAAKKTKAGRRR